MPDFSCRPEAIFTHDRVPQVGHGLVQPLLKCRGQSGDTVSHVMFKVRLQTLIQRLAADGGRRDALRVNGIQDANRIAYNQPALQVVR